MAQPTWAQEHRLASPPASPAPSVQDPDSDSDSWSMYTPSRTPSPSPSPSPVPSLESLPFSSTDAPTNPPPPTQFEQLLDLHHTIAWLIRECDTEGETAEYPIERLTRERDAARRYADELFDENEQLQEEVERLERENRGLEGEIREEREMREWEREEAEREREEEAERVKVREREERRMGWLWLGGLWLVGCGWWVVVMVLQAWG
ncbi:hypothetical protein EJ04DRAFT_565686 [Polyplosphaeria fusca]|uniref:Uncharacterized protein n=1 Tax=Polyplosphaeria fusca TaxID=682080 RepID=A0A9P4QUA8_9PLEO|nr:hypothetical protein EJ04DRAFT_565686 [Polyplosphaeria fusca]